MKRAIEAIKGGLMGVSRASSNFGVPKTTLRDRILGRVQHGRDRISGRVQHGSKSGPQPYLTEDEEEELASFLKQASQVGYGKTKKEVLAIIQKMVQKKGHRVK